MEINDGWIYRIVCPTFNLFWRQILCSVSDTFNGQRTGLLTLIEDCPTDSDFQLISPENCLEYEDKVITEQILNSKVTQFPLFLKPQEKYRQISLALESNIKKAHHCDFFNFVADQTLCNINGLINYNKIPAKYKSEEFKIFSLALDKSFKYWRKMSDMDIFVEHSLSKRLPFIPIRCSFKNYNQEIPNRKPVKLFNECVNSILDIEDIERIAREYGCEFKKVLGINLYNTHFTTNIVYYINGYYEQVTQKIARDEFIEFKNSNLECISHLLKHINPLMEYFSKNYPNDVNLRDFFQLKENLDRLYQIADARYKLVFQRDYDTKEIDVI